MEVPRGSPSGCGNLRRAGPSPSLCAPPKTLRTLQPTPPASQPVPRHEVPWAAPQQPPLPGFGSGLFPAASDSHPGDSLAAAGARRPPCAGLAGGAGAAFQITTSPDRAACYPAPPTPSLPRRSGRAQHLLSPSPPAAEDHTLRLALLTHPPDAAGEGEGSPLLFPGAGRSVWGQGAQEMPRRCVSRTGMLTPSSSAGSSSGGGSGGSGSSSSSSGDCAGSLQATSFIPYTSLPHSPE